MPMNRKPVSSRAPMAMVVPSSWMMANAMNRIFRLTQKMVILRWENQDPAENDAHGFCRGWMANACRGSGARIPSVCIKQRNHQVWQNQWPVKQPAVMLRQCGRQVDEFDHKGSINDTHSSDPVSPMKILAGKVVNKETKQATGKCESHYSIFRVADIIKISTEEQGGEGAEAARKSVNPINQVKELVITMMVNSDRIMLA